MIKIAYLVQSYEEVPFLMFLLSIKKLDEKIIIFNYGNSDLKNHLSNLLENSNTRLLNNTLDNRRKFNNIFMYLVMFIKFMLKHYWISIIFFRKIDRLYFFQPFLSFLISSIQDSKHKRICYQPLPGLVRRKLINESGKYTQNSSKNIKENKLRRLLIRIIFGKHLHQRFIGLTKVAALNDELLDKLINNKNKISFSMADYEKYKTSVYTTLLNSQIKKNGQMKVIYFEQHYLERNLVDKDKYTRLIKDISKLCDLKNLELYIKPHPGKSLPNFYNHFAKLNILEAKTPAEFYIDKNTICISTSSGALGSNLCKLNLSLIFLVPFLDKSLRQNVFKALTNKIAIKTYTPKKIIDIDTLFESINELNSVPVKNINYIEPLN